MSEHLSITIPRGYGQVQSLADGSLQVTVDMGNSLDGYRDLSRSFIELGVGLMFRGRKLHGDLREVRNQDDAPASRPM